MAADAASTTYQVAGNGKALAKTPVAGKAIQIGQAGDAADQQPRNEHRSDARGQRHACPCDGQHGAGARQQHGARAGERMWAPQPPQPGRRVRHGSALTA